MPHVASEACGSLGTLTLIFIAPICALHGFLSCLYSFGGRPAFVLLCLELCCRLTCSNCSNTFFSSPAVLCFLVSALGITAGSHRLWSHRSYKATLPLRIFLTIANSMAFQVSTSSICHWSSEGSAPLNPCLRYGAQADGGVPLSYYLVREQPALSISHCGARVRLIVFTLSHQRVTLR